MLRCQRVFRCPSNISLCVPPLPVTAIPIFGAGKQHFPVRRVYCVGQNYNAHAAEMGNKTKQPPFFFTKPTDAVIPQVDADADVHIPYPRATSRYDHEVELVVALDKDVPVLADAKEAMKSVFGYTVGLDMTRRDLQAEAKNSGRPWDLAKGADASAPVAILRRAADIGHPGHGSITLFVNGKETQRGDLSDMTWSVGEVLSHLNQFVQLKGGDIIFTGTPAGVGPVKSGDVVEACIEGVGRLTVGIDAVH